MNKTIYYYESRGSNKRLTVLQKMNEYLNLGYNIVVIPPVEQGASRGKKSKQFYIDGEYFDLNESQFEEDDVETIAGLVVKLLGRIAEVGDVVSYNGLTFTVTETEGARITKLQLYREVEQNISINEEA